MFASEATRSRVANRVTYSAYSRFATSKPSEQKTAATRAVRHTMRRLGRNLKMTKNSATPRAKEVNSRLRRHSQSIAKLRLTLPALRASQVATSAPSTSSVPVQNTMARSSTLAIGHDPRTSDGRCRSPTDASRARPSRAGFVLLLEARPLGAAAAVLGLRQPALDRDAGGGRLLLFVVGGLEQLARLLGREIAQPAQLVRQFGAGGFARLGREQEPEHGPQTQAQQEGPEPPAPFAHSPASRSSGSATATRRGCPWDWGGGLTSRPVM